MRIFKKTLGNEEIPEGMVQPGEAVASDHEEPYLAARFWATIGPTIGKKRLEKLWKDAVHRLHNQLPKGQLVIADGWLKLEKVVITPQTTAIFAKAVAACRKASGQAAAVMVAPKGAIHTLLFTHGYKPA